MTTDNDHKLKFSVQATSNISKLTVGFGLGCLMHTKLEATLPQLVIHLYTHTHNVKQKNQYYPGQFEFPFD